METNSGLDGGNYCVVYITKLTLAIKFYTYHSLIIYYLQFVASMKWQDYDCSFILIEAATEAAQPKSVSQSQSMSPSA